MLVHDELINSVISWKAGPEEGPATIRGLDDSFTGSDEPAADDAGSVYLDSSGRGAGDASNNAGLGRRGGAR
jgi:hypothetical protein